jgi:cell division protein FtsZ
MGGGTGTGGAPVVAEIAREMDILTVAIVTRPFLFEGKIRDRNARKGIDDLRKHVDTIIVIPNQKLLSIVDRKTSLIDAFKTADEVLYQATRGISDLISRHGLVNLDFADVRTIMKGMGDALMGAGLGEGDNRAVLAADSAIHSPLLDDISIVGAKGILINITGGEDMTLYDVSDATQTVQDAVGEDAESNIIFGAVIDPEMNGKIQVTVIATGFNETTIEEKRMERNTARLEIRMPQQGKKAEENAAEQMTIELPAKKLEEVAMPVPVLSLAEVAPEDDSDTREMPILSSAERPRLTIERPSEAASAMREAREVHASNPSLEMPVVFRKETVRKEQVFVSKGQVITHYEDDMDVPTFLRKQMQ